jgi:hypothetical protein
MRCIINVVVPTSVIVAGHSVVSVAVVYCNFTFSLVFRLIALIVVVAITSETSVKFYQTHGATSQETFFHLHLHRRENLRSNAGRFSSLISNFQITLGIFLVVFLYIV